MRVSECTVSLIPKLGPQDPQWHHVWAVFSLALACIFIWQSTLYSNVLGPPSFFLNKETHIWFQIAALLLFGGWVLLTFGTVLTLSWIFISQGLCQRRVSAKHLPVQFTLPPVIGTILGLLIFPCSLDSAFANEIGGSSSTYNAGKCKFGWDYMVAILDVVMSKIFFSTAIESRMNITH
uniref:Uncharacterized protein n=1 Tax=Chelonoidis abingdonii TaxID=106734 RepID=A0A8C0GLK6_CHEAB